jgi:organic hydroperoxide reductase OsmC/OhrA
MSEHITQLVWQRNGGDFVAKTYSRDHVLSFKPGEQLNVSAAPAYGGNAACVDPEEILTGALSSCHMLTFLAVAALKGYVVENYTDRAVGVLEKDAEGKISVTRVALHPKVSFSGREPTTDELAALHERAHRGCFVANSVKTDVTIVSG